MRKSLVVLFILLTTAVGLVSREVTYRQAEREVLAIADNRITIYSATLRSAMERLSHLPETAAIHPSVTGALSGTGNIEAANRYLAAVNESAGAAALYLMNPDGITIAASNHATPDSFVGQYYGFRNYFQDAMRGATGRYFAVGATTGRPGYFIASPVRVKGAISGVAVVKTEFAELLADWREGGERILITDDQDVVILSSDPTWAFRLLRSVSDERIESLRATRKYGETGPQPPVYEIPIQLDRPFDVSGETVLASGRPIAGRNWTLYYLSNLEDARTAAWTAAAIAALLCGIGGIGALYFLQRRRQKLLENEAADASRIRTINQRLTEEIRVRKKTEAQLLEMQDELVMSSRLAALGRMSAAIVHEVNQPVSAIRNYVASAMLLVKNRRGEEAEQTLGQIREMTERLGAITSELLVFSRKPVARRETVDLNECVRRIVRQYEPEATANSVTISQKLSREKTTVSGSTVRFEQLISNLVKNALQAATDGPRPKNIEIATNCDTDAVKLTVRDSGHGVDPAIQSQLFDPFFTTKPVGAGVGLGLALCYAITDEAGGRIRCFNHPKDGAVFEVTLPHVSVRQVEAAEA